MAASMIRRVGRYPNILLFNYIERANMHTYILTFDTHIVIFEEGSSIENILWLLFLLLWIIYPA